MFENSRSMEEQIKMVEACKTHGDPAKFQKKSKGKTRINCTRKYKMD